MYGGGKGWWVEEEAEADDAMNMIFPLAGLRMIAEWKFFSKITFCCNIIFVDCFTIGTLVNGVESYVIRSVCGAGDCCCRDNP